MVHDHPCEVRTEGVHGLLERAVGHRSLHRDLLLSQGDGGSLERPDGDQHSSFGGRVLEDEEVRLTGGVGSDAGGPDLHQALA